MSVDSIERAAALAALVAGNAPAEEQAEPSVVRTGDEVYAGGDEARLLIRPASTLGYPTANGYQRVGAIPGDVVLLTKRQAARLDALGVTVAADADLDEVAKVADETGYTDEQIAALGAEELVAYVGQHPEEAGRVRDLELAKRETKRRKSVLAATDPDVLEAALAAQVAAAALDDADGDPETGAAPEDGPTAEEVAEANQGNDAPGAGE